MIADDLPELVVPYVRCFVEPTNERKQGKRPADGWRSLRYGERVLVFDTETTSRSGPDQSLLVGGYLVAQWDDKRGDYAVEERGLFLPDDAGQEHRRLVERFACERGLEVKSRTEFARILIQEGYELGSLVVSFNLPFDLSRIATKWGPGRGAYRTGFRLVLINVYSAPRIRLRTTTRPRAFIEWGSCRTTRRREGDRSVFRGRFVDLHRWTYAMGWGKLTLEEACEAAGIPYRKRPVEYGRLSEDLLAYLVEDVEATYKLYLSLRREWNKLPFTPIPSPPIAPGSGPEDTPDLDPTSIPPHRLQSPASLSKALLRKMGIRPLLERQPDFPREILGIFMSTLYGGHGEARVPATRVPVRYCDISSTYLNLARLLRLWDIIVAERVEVEDATEEVREFVARVTLEDLYWPSTWPRLAAVCLVEPEGDILPVLSKFEGEYLLALNPTYSIPMWWTLPDVVASKIRTGCAPKILWALRVVGRGRAATLQPVTLYGQTISPRDAFGDLLVARSVWGRRQQAWAKLAKQAPPGSRQQELSTRNAAQAKRIYRAIKALIEPFAYGVWVEWDDTAHEDKPVRAHAGTVTYEARMKRLERPGSYCNPLVGVFPPAACRLAMAMMEVEVDRAGGTIARFATDAVNIVATPQGGPLRLPGSREIRALSYEEVDRLRRKFEPLGPPGSPFWKLEPENRPHPQARKDPNLYLYAVSTHRFVLGNRLDNGTWCVRRYSLHGLGSLVLPSGFAEELWREVVEKNGKVDPARWAHLPAAYRITLTRPELLKRTAPELGMRPFDFAVQIGLLNGLVPLYRTGTCKLTGEQSPGCPQPNEPCRYRERCPLARPARGIMRHSDNPEELPDKPVWDRETGKLVEVDWNWSREQLGTVHPITLGYYVAHYLKPDDPRYQNVAGLLHRRPLTLLPDPLTGGPIASGRRAHLVDRLGEEHVEEDEVEAAILQPSTDDPLRAVVRKAGPAEVARLAGVYYRQLKYWLAGRKNLSTATRHRITRATWEIHRREEMFRFALKNDPTPQETAHVLEVDRKTVWRYRTGEIRPSPERRDRYLQYRGLLKPPNLSTKAQKARGRRKRTRLEAPKAPERTTRILTL